MLSRGHWDSAELLTLGEVVAGWHRACSPTPTPSRGRRETEVLSLGWFGPVVFVGFVLGGTCAWVLMGGGAFSPLVDRAV